MTSAVLTVTADAKSKVYGAANPALTVSYSGFVNGEDASSLGGTVAVVTVAQANSPIGSYDLTEGEVTVTNGNYSLSFVAGTLTVTPYGLTVTADAQTKVYGTSDPALTYQITSGSLVNGDTLSGSLTRASGEAVASYAIQQGSLAASANYALTYAGANLSITAAPLTVTADAQTKVYGTSDPALTYQVTSGSLVNGDMLTGSLTRAAGEDAGSYAIQQGTVAASANYSVTYAGANLVITAAPLTVTADAKTKVYGTSDPALTYQITSGALVNGDSLSGSLTRVAGENAGSYAIQQGSVAASANYSVTYAGASLAITAAPLTVAADAKTKVYGTSDPALTYQVTSGSLINGDTLTGSLTRAAGENAGSYAILQGSVAASANYSVTYAGANLAITPAPLGGTVAGASRAYGDTNPVFTVSYSGFVGGDTAGVLGGSLVFQCVDTNAADVTTNTPVGVYPIHVAAGQTDANYGISYADGSLTVTSAVLTVTADAKSKVYGAANPALTVSYSGFVNGEDASSLGGTVAVVTVAQANSPIGSYDLTEGEVTVTNGNYSLSFVAGTLTVTPYGLTVTADAQTKVYGTSDPALTYRITSGSLVNRDTLSGSLTRASGEAVASYAIQQGSLAASANYALTYAGANLSITAAPLTVTADAKTKVYGTSDPALTYQVTSGSLVNGDMLTGSLTRAAGEDAGSYAIQQGSVAASANYSVTYAGASLVITAAPLTVAADAKTKVYGTSDPALTYQITSGALVNGDSLSGSLTRVAGENAGSYAIQQGSVAASANYSVTYAGANLVITAAPLTVAADAKTKVYGTSDPALTYQVTSGSLINGDTLTGSLTRAAGENAGSYAILQGSVAASANYSVTYAGANLAITPAPLGGTVAGASRAYGDTNPVFTVSYSGFVGGDTAGVLGGSLVFQCVDTNAADVTTNTPVGVYPIHVATGQTAGNYGISYADGSLTVTSAVLTVTADAKSKVYGAANPALTVSYSGFVNGEDASSLGGTVAVVTVAQANSPIGSYDLTEGEVTVTNGNYSLSFVAGTLTVTPYGLTVTADAQTKVYGTKRDPALTYQITSGSLVNGDTLSGSLTRASGEAVASYAIQQGSLAASANYALTYAGANLSITAAPLTVTADAQTKVYGTTDPALTYQVTSGSLVNGDMLTGSLTRAAGEDAGSYAIQQGTVEASANYSVTYAGANLVITAAPLTVTADAKTKVYGTSDPALTYQITSGALVNGDSLSGSLTRVAGENAGSYAIQQGSVAASANYSVTYAGASLAITAAPLTVAADAKTKVYGTSDPALTYQVTSGSLINGDTLTGSLTRAAGENAGSYAILQGSVAASANYSVTYAGANLAITPAPLGGTVAGASRAYGDTNPVFTVSYSGFVGGDTAGVLGGSLVFQCVDTNAADVTTNTPVGVYPIHVATGQTAGNYGISYADGSLTVTSAVLTVTADAKSKVYGAANPALTVSYSGFVNGEDASSLGGTVAVVTVAQANSPIGSYDLTEGEVTVTNGNYSLSFVAGTLTVTPYGLTVTADAQTKVYGTSDPALTYQITSGSLVNGDTLSGSLTRASGEAVASYAIQQGSLAASANYALTYAGANLSITAAPLTVTADAQTKVYGTTDPALTYQVTSGSLVNGDMLTGSLTRAAGEDAGSYAIQQGTLTAGGNYALVFGSADLTITAAPTTITWANPEDITYGTALSAVQLNAVGSVAGVLNYTPGERARS